MTVIVIILCIFSFLIVWQFGGYPLLMGIISLKSKPLKKDYSYQPYVSVIVPTYNEEKVIGKKIANLLELDYPRDRYEIIVVDSGSKDRTSEIVMGFIDNYRISGPRIELIQEGERRGKVSAINLGVKVANGTVILISDANSVYGADVLKELVPHFKDESVGAVSGRYCTYNPSEGLAGCEALYWEIEHLIFQGESLLDSVSTVIGTISCWRRELVNFRADTVAEDLDMTIQVRKRGFGVKYEPAAIAFERSATTWHDQIRQRRRTCLGTIQNFFKHFAYFAFPRDKFSLLIFHSHKTLQICSPIIFISILMLYIILWNPWIAAVHFLITSALVFLFFLSLVSLRQKSVRNGRAQSNLSVQSISKIIRYVLLNEYIVLAAWKDFIFGEHTLLWERAETTR